MPATISGTEGFQGNLTGNVTGNITGNVTGNLTGNVTGALNALGSFTNPATNALEILNAGLSTGDGPYWIRSTSGPPVLTFCDMANGGYMLVGVVANNGQWNYNSVLWNSRNNPFFERRASLYQLGTDALDMRSPLYDEYVMTVGMRMCLGNKNNALAISASGRTVHSFFNGPYQGTSFGRTVWTNWFNVGLNRVDGQALFANQPNCNSEGINLVTPNATIRFGILFNNENECNSCDSGIGFGLTIGPTQVNSGAFQWSPNTAHTAPGYIFVL